MKRKFLSTMKTSSIDTYENFIFFKNSYSKKANYRKQLIQYDILWIIILFSSKVRARLSRSITLFVSRNNRQILRTVRLVTMN